MSNNNQRQAEPSAGLSIADYEKRLRYQRPKEYAEYMKWKKQQEENQSQQTKTP
jgi:hypothetical protein